MAERRYITKEGILLKTRLLAEGVRYEVKDPSLWKPPGGYPWDPSSPSFSSPVVVFDGYDAGKGCKYCGPFAANAPLGPPLSFREQLATTEWQTQPTTDRLG